jgi:hypothetical protein
MIDTDGETTLRVGCFGFERNALNAAAVVNDKLQDVGQIKTSECQGRYFVSFASIPLKIMRKTSIQNSDDNDNNKNNSVTIKALESASR